MRERPLPPGWVWTTLAEVTDTQRKRVKPQDYPHLKFVGMDNIEAHTMRLLGTVPANEMKSSAEYFDPDDVLYGRLRPYLNKVFRPDFEGLCSAEFIAFRKVSHLESKYLQYFLNSAEFVSFASRLNTGDRPRINFAQIADYPFPLPPLPEQQRIVAEIEKQMTRLEAGVAALKRAQARLRRYKAAVLKAACEGRLVPQDPADEPAAVLLGRILAERRRRWEAEQRAKGKDPSKLKYKEPAPPDTDGLPGLPEGWGWATVEQIGATGEQAVLTGPFGSNLGRSDFITSGVPVLTIGCLTEQGLSLGKAFYISDEKASELERYRVKSGDLLFSRMATVGRADMVTPKFEGAIINYHLMRLRLAENVIIPNYFITYVRGSEVVIDYVREVNHGATRDGINTRQLLNLPVALPPRPEQQRIVAEVERRLSVVEGMEVALEANLKRAERLRQAVLKQAFEGRLVPQDPSDEPASALLARIREAKAEAKGNKKRGQQLKLPGVEL